MNFLSCFKSCQSEYLNTFTKIYDHDTRLAYIEKQVIPPGYFVFNSERGFAHISTTGSQADGSMNLGDRNESFLMVQKFSIKYLSAMKTFLFQ